MVPDISQSVFKLFKRKGDSTNDNTVICWDTTQRNSWHVSSTLLYIDPG